MISEARIWIRHLGAARFALFAAVLLGYVPGCSRLVRTGPTGDDSLAAVRAQGNAEEVRAILADSVALVASYPSSWPVLKRAVGGEFGDTIKVRALRILTQTDGVGCEQLDWVLANVDSTSNRTVMACVLDLLASPATRKQVSFAAARSRALAYEPGQKFTFEILNGSRDFELRCKAAGALRIVDPYSIPSIIAGLKLDAPDTWRQTAATLLGILSPGQSDVLGPLIETATNDPSSDVRAEAAHTIGIIGVRSDATCATLLFLSKSDTVDVVRNEAARSLIALGCER